MQEQRRQIYFEAHPKGNQILFALIEPGLNNMPDYSKAKELLFTKTDKGVTDPQTPKAFPGSPRGPQEESPGNSGQSADAADVGVYYSFSSAGPSYSGGTEKDR